VLKHNTMEMQRSSSTYSGPQHWTQITVQFYVPTALLLVKKIP